MGIVGYSYRADIYCPRCIRGQLHGSSAEPDYSADLEVEQLLDELAVDRGVDRADEWSFDSGDFPKPITQENVEREGRLSECGHCGCAVGSETDSLRYYWKTEAGRMGVQAAKDNASWTVDGNSDTAERARILAMMRDGDGQAFDYLPTPPNLSGEMADDPTPRSLAAEVAGAEPEPDTVDAIADAWEDAAGETFERACEAELIKFCEERPLSAREVIARAVEVEPTIDPDACESSKFERCADRPLALALVTIVGHGLQDEFSWDSNDTSWDRVDRWLVAQTEDGFWVVEEFATAKEASAKLAELALECEHEVYRRGEQTGYRRNPTD